MPNPRQPISKIAMDDLRRSIESLQAQVGDLRQATGRTEGKIDQVLAEQANAAGQMAEHKGDDRNSFSVIGARMGLLEKKIDENDEKRDGQLGGIKQDQDRAKGAGWVILGILSALAAFVGSAVIAVWSGHIRLH